MQYDFDSVIDRRMIPNLNRWKLFDEDVLPLWIADMDFRTPEPILAELRAALDHGVFGYELIAPAVLERIAARLQRLYGWAVSADWLVPIPNVNVGYRVAATVACTAGEGVLIQPPVFNDFVDFPPAFGFTLQNAPLRRIDNGQLIRYEMDLDAVRAAIHAGGVHTGMVMLCNPHNPVGRAYTPAELLGLASICVENDVLICSDDIHNELALGGARYAPLVSLLPTVADRTITLIGAGKNFNASGLGCAFAIIPDAARREAYIRELARLGINFPTSPGLIAARAAYSGACDDWQSALCEYLTANRDFLVAFVQAELPLMRTTVPEATYLGWLDCSGYVDEGIIPGSPFDFFLERARVGLTNGAAFGSGGQGFVRLNFATPRVVLEEALDRMRRALAGAKLLPG